MKVKDLIDELNECDPEALVMLWHPDHDLRYIDGVDAGDDGFVDINVSGKENVENPLWSLIELRNFNCSDSRWEEFVVVNNVSYEDVKKSLRDETRPLKAVIYSHVTGSETLRMTNSEFVKAKAMEAYYFKQAHYFNKK